MIHYQKRFTTAKGVVVLVGTQGYMVENTAGLPPLEVFRQVCHVYNLITERGGLYDLR